MGFCSKALIALALALTANALSITNVFPYAPFMVKFFGLVDDDRALGFYAGFFMSALQLGALLSALFWGVMSDRFGKKRIIIIGLLSSTVPQALFGVATSMPTALTLRFMMGLFNGLIGAAKALAPELVPPTEQASAMSIIAATWGFGNLLGPAIGGFTSMYHLCEGDTSTRCPDYPFILPNAICASLSALSLIAVACLLPSDRHHRQAGQGLTAARLSSSTSDAPPPTEAPHAEGDRVALRESSDSNPRGPARVLTRSSVATIAFYGALSFFDIVNNEIFPLWCVAPAASGGLDLDTTTLGWVLSASGLVLVIYQVFVFPPISRRYSITRLCLLGNVAAGFLYAATPFVTLVQDERTRLAVLLLQASSLRVCIGTTFTCTFTILNNCVAAPVRGRMQGVAMTIGSLARFVGPTLGAEIFAWSLTSGLAFPLDVHFVFLLMCALNAAPVALALITFTRALDLPLEASPAPPSSSSSGAGADQGKVWPAMELESAVEGGEAVGARASIPHASGPKIGEDGAPVARCGVDRAGAACARSEPSFGVADPNGK